MNVSELNDIEFCELIKEVITRLKNENNSHILVEIPWHKNLIIIEDDDEINEQYESRRRDGFFLYKNMIKIDKHIKL